jgi:hypothetical protein
MLFRKTADAFADTVITIAAVQGKSLTEYIDTLNPPETSDADKERWNKNMLSVIEKSRLSGISDTIPS